MSFIAIWFAKLTGFLHRYKFGATLIISAVFIFFGSHSVLADAAADAAAAATAAAASASTGTTVLTNFVVSFLPLALATILSIIAMVLGKLIVVVIGMVIIPILGYNGFATSGVVDIGWPLVRDVVNMFVVIVLLIIAVKTILGMGKANWEQQLPRLFLAVVAVNFSRTICLLLIDFGQVVMWTFVSAIRDIAAGNFVNLFQLNSFMAIGESWLAGPGNAGLNAFGFLGGAYATVVLLSMVLAVMLLLAVIFIYRIVILWVLIIMSPLAFFLGGISDVLGSAGGQYAQWWKKMIGAVTLGPILTFFLWLALAAASTGPIATSEGFSTVSSVDTASTLATLPSEIFQMDKLLSLFIAIVLITVGFQAASTQAGALGGIAAQFVTEKGGMDLAKGLAAAPAALGYRGIKAVGAGGKMIGIEMAKQAEGRLKDSSGTGIGTLLGRDIIKAGEKLRSVPLIGGFAANAVSGVGSDLQNAASASNKDAREKAGKKVEGMSDDAAMARRDQVMSPGYEAPELLSEQGKDAQLMVKGLDKDFASDEKARLKAGIDQAPLLAAATASGLSGQAAIDAADKSADKTAQVEVDRRAKKTLDFFKDEGNARNYIGDDEGKKKSLLRFKANNLHNMVDSSGNLDKKEIDKTARDSNFNPLDVKNPDVFKNPVVMSVLDGVNTGRDKDGQPVSVGDNVRSGIGISGTVKSAMPEILAQQLGATKPDGSPAMSQDQIVKAIKSGLLDLKSIPPAVITPAVAQQLAKAMIGSGVSMQAGALPTDPTARGHFINAATSELNKNRSRAKTDKELADIDKHIEELTDSVEDAHGFTSNGTVIQESERGHKQGGDRSLAVNVKQDITYINKFPSTPSGLPAFGPNSEAAAAATSQLDANDISNMIKKMHSVDAIERAEIQKALRALQPMVHANAGTLGTPEHTRLSAVDRRINDALAIPPSAFI